MPLTKCPNGLFLNALLDCLNYIDNDLKVTRNRFVHDIWSPTIDVNAAIKTNLTPKITMMSDKQ